VRVEIRGRTLLALKRHAGRDYPRECCGFLIGRVRRRGGQRRVVIEEARPAENLNKERAYDRYEIDPRAFQGLQDSLRGTGRVVVGFYHSHPDHPSRPSLTDLERLWEGMIYVIVGVDGKGSAAKRYLVSARGRRGKRADQGLKGGARKRYCVSAWSLEEHDLAPL
jgi:proteasome lid subunit RPN8/RPN11